MIIKLADNPDIYKKIAETLDGNGVVALPTDTGYELAVQGTSTRALNRLGALKINQEPPTFFIARSQLSRYAVLTKKKIIDYFLPGSLGVILKKKSSAPLGLGEEKITVRIPDNKFIVNLLDYYQKPIATIETAATPSTIAGQFPDIDLIVDAGPPNDGKKITVVDLTHKIPILKKKGGVSLLEIEKIFGRLIKIDPALKFHLLLVCSGNSCRSPMAAGIIKTMVDEKYVEIKSAGTAAIDGLPASENAQSVVREFGGDISSHRTRYLTREMVAEADLILVMEYKHYETIIELSPEAAVKTFLLKEYKRFRKYRNEVSDPVGKDLSVYRDTALEMYPSLKFVAKEIKKRLLL
ncbi:MAG: Sua5/YciO/YrdC/YwlC family protein [candidate division WOR-3 bacterium]